MSLIKIRKDVQSVAEVIAAALKVETEIVDSESRVLGATGRIRGHLMTKRSDVFINQYVMSKAQPFVFANPGKHKLCQPCLEKEECIFTGGIFYPIMVRGKCHGVISLVSFDKRQKEILLDNQEVFLDFIAKMAELLGSKLAETLLGEQMKINMEYLEAIIQSVSEGIIACDESGIITCFNKTAEQVLGITGKEAVGRHVSAINESLIMKCLTQGCSILQEKVVYTHESGKKLPLISSAMIIKSNGQISGAVESFSEEAKIMKAAYRLSAPKPQTAFDRIIGNSKAINNLKTQALKVARNSSTILITGDSGTGKELLARAIHNSSSRCTEPLVAINCSAIPDSLLESELFGYERGAFTGARSEGKRGTFEEANGGTIFLDEIGDMPVHLQSKLLRVIQERTIQKVGGTKSIPVDVRIIAATHQNLRELIEKKQFREDLYYRLNVIPLNIVPLKDRKEDIPVLMEYLCQKYSALFHKSIKGFTPEVMKIFLQYDWPGNVRELENAIEYVINFCPDNSEVAADFLPAWILNTEPSNQKNNYKHKLETGEKEIILEALRSYGSSLEGKKQIAENLGISLSTLYRLLRKYHLLDK